MKKHNWYEIFSEDGIYYLDVNGDFYDSYYSREELEDDLNWLAHQKAKGII